MNALSISGIDHGCAYDAWRRMPNVPDTRQAVISGQKSMFLNANIAVMIKSAIARESFGNILLAAARPA